MAGDRGHYSGAVVHYESNVVGHHKVSVDSGAGAGDVNGTSTMGYRHQVRNDRDRGGMAARSMAGKDGLASVLSTGNHHVFRAPRPGQRRSAGDQHRTYRGQQFLIPDLGARNLPDGAIQILGIGKVDRGNIADGAAGN